jgi:hypothetical protein
VREDEKQVMNFEDDTGDAFAADDLWRTSRFAFAPLEPLPPIVKEEATSDLIRKFMPWMVRSIF